MSHRRESGAVPPWVIPEQHVTNLNTQNFTQKHRQHHKTNPLNQNYDVFDKTDKISQAKDQQNLNLVPEQPDPISPVAEGDKEIKSPVQEKKDRLLIVGGELANSDYVQQTNILIENGKIISIGLDNEIDSDTLIVNASGMLIMPGGIDIATYIIDDLENLDVEAYINTTKEALLGGTTTIVDTIICPKGKLPLDIFNQYRECMKNRKFWCDVIIRIGLLEIDEKQLNQLDDLVKIHGINSFLFFVSDTEFDQSSNQSSFNMHTNLINALTKCRQLGVVAMIRPHRWSLSGENSMNSSTIKPDQAELKASEKAILFAASSNCPVILASPSNWRTLEEVAKARRHVPPIHITTSCTPGNLLPAIINDQNCASKFLNFITTGEITSISCDQCGPSPLSKSLRLGAIGQRLVAIWEAGVSPGWLDASSFVNIGSANAAKYCGLYPTKGHLAPGSDADLILWPMASLSHSGLGYPNLVILHGHIMAYKGMLIDNSNAVQENIKMNEKCFNIPLPKPVGVIKTGQIFPSVVYGPVMATERLRQKIQLPVIRDSWALGNLSEELLSTLTVGDTVNHATADGSNVSIDDTQKHGSPSSPPLSVRMIHGHRDLHASGFSLSGAQVDDDRPIRSGIRTRQPPGGGSHNPLW